MSKNKSKKGGITQRLTTIFCLVVFVSSLIYIVDIVQEYYSNRQVLADVQKVYRSKENHTFKRDSDEDFSQTDNQEIRSSFHDLLKINQNINGWITIDNTLIDYPILQAADNQFYLDKNYLDEPSIAGSIFMDYRNDILGTDRNTILYGHKMRDGTMFTQLKKYLDEDFFRENQHFYFDTLYEGYDVEVFSAYLTTTDFYYIETDFDSDEEYSNFLKEIQEKSEVPSGAKLTANDRIITLSTCDYLLDPNQGRLVVHGKLVKR